VDEEITAAFEELRRAVLENDAEAMLARLSPDHPLRVEYATEDELAKAMWIHPVPRAERETIIRLEVVDISRDPDDKTTYVIKIRTPDGKDFVLYAEKYNGRWVFR
jgi:hypothetical protein